MPILLTHERILLRLAELTMEPEDPTEALYFRPLARKTQNNIMIPLRSLFALICNSDKTLANPTDGIGNLKVQRPAPDPFSVAEVERILKAVHKVGGEEVADYFEYDFFAGFRSSEQIALLWPDLDLRKWVAVVWRARVMGKDKERTKTQWSRARWN